MLSVLSEGHVSV